MAHLQVDTNARVVSVKGNDAISHRLLEMGVTPGATIRVIKNAPFGCPIEIKVRNSHLAIRRSEAAAILVESEK